MQRYVEHLALVQNKRDAYKIPVGKSEGKRRLRRHRHRWEDNIKMEIGQGEI
jgi:hypothetical protein